MRFLTAAVITSLLLVLYVCTVAPQTCPIASYTAGFTGQSAYSPTSRAGIYVNEGPDHQAQCNGTVFSWNYCYYPGNSNEVLEVAFGVYDYDFNVSRYFLRNESYLLNRLNVTDSDANFTCYTITLSPAQHFQIFEGDRVGVCMRNYNGTYFADILASNVTDNASVAMVGDALGGCELSDMASQLRNNIDSQMGKILHLYVDVDIEECSTGLANCHDTLATCSNVVGSNGSFLCTCIPGYTGNGVHCANINECLLIIDLCVENAVCADTEGSYTCMCSIGYSGDGFNSCTNTNECLLGLDVCVDNSVCADTDGNYTCLCSNGFSGNGFISCTNETSGNYEFLTSIGVIFGFAVTIVLFITVAIMTVAIIVLLHLLRKSKNANRKTKLNAQYVAQNTASLRSNAAYVSKDECIGTSERPSSTGDKRKSISPPAIQRSSYCTTDENRPYTSHIGLLSVSDQNLNPKHQYDYTRPLSDRSTVDYDDSSEYVEMRRQNSNEDSSSYVYVRVGH